LTTSAIDPRIRLPSDLAKSLKHLEDNELRRLHDAVTAEIARRVSVLREKQLNRVGGLNEPVEEIPEGKVNLIQASFQAGLTPAAIARTLSIPLALVRHVLK
jgi:hypothetical protein